MSSTTDHTNVFLRREVAAIVGWGWFWGGDGGGRFRRGMAALGTEAGRRGRGFESGLRKNGRYYLQRRRYKVLSALLALSDERSEEFKLFRQHFIPAALLVIPHFPDGTHKTPAPPASLRPQSRHPPRRNRPPPSPPQNQPHPTMVHNLPPILRKTLGI